MFKQLRYTIRDLKRNYVTVLMFIGELLFSVFFVMISADQLIANQQQANLMQRIQGYNITCFHTYYTGDSIRLDSAGNQLLSQLLNGDEQMYSFISTSIENLPGTDVIVGLGKFGEVYGIWKDNVANDGFHVLVGSKLEHLKIGDKIKIGGYGNTTLSIDGRLPRNSTFLNANYSGIVSLDKSIVILTTYEQWMKYSPFSNLDNIIGNACFLSPSEEEVLSYVETIAKSSDFTIIPASFNEQLLKMYASAFQSGVTLLAFFLSTIVLIGVGVAANLAMSIDRNLQEYGIHRLYGATLRDMYVRTIQYIAIIVFIPFLAVYFVISSFLSVTDLLSVVMLAMASLMVCLVSVYPIAKLRNQDLAAFLRKE